MKVNDKYCIPERNTNESKFDLEEFIGIYQNGAGDTIYDKFANEIKYYDYSTSGILGLIRNGHIGNKLFNSKSYYDYFKRLVVPLVGDEEGQGKQITPEKEQELLGKISGIVAEHKHMPVYEDLASYVEYAKYSYKSRNMDNNVAPEIDELHKAIVDTALEYATPKEISAMRQQIVTNVIVKEIKSKKARETKCTAMIGGVEKRSASNDPEWNFYNDMLIAINTADKLRDYDSDCEEYTKVIQEALRKEELKLKCKRIRNKVVQKELAAALDLPPRTSIADADIFSNIGVDNRPAKEGTYAWRFREFKQPQVLINGYDRYSATGEADQRVVAVSYGNLEYGTLNNGNQYTYNSSMLNLLGITRKGEDGNKTYFVLCPLNQEKLRKVQPGMSTKGKNVLKTKQGEFIVELSEKMPNKSVDFASAIAFSDYYLDLVNSQNYGCVGTITKDGKLDLSSGNYYDVCAARYAKTYPGYINGQKVSSLKDYIDSVQLNDKHLKTVQKAIIEARNRDNPNKEKEGEVK